MKAVYLEEAAVNRGDITLDPITSCVETKVYANTTEADKYEHIGDADIVFSNKIIFDEETFQRLSATGSALLWSLRVKLWVLSVMEI